MLHVMARWMMSSMRETPLPDMDGPRCGPWYETGSSYVTCLSQRIAMYHTREYLISSFGINNIWMTRGNERIMARRCKQRATSAIQGQIKREIPVSSCARSYKDRNRNRPQYALAIATLTDEA